MDAETSLDSWISHNWRDTPRPPWPRETFKLFYEQQLAYQAKARVKSAEAREIDQLRAEVAQLRAERAADAKRIHALEKLTAIKGPLMESIGIALAETAHNIELKYEPRIEALEQRPAGLSWQGTWVPEKDYPASGVVIKDGAAWVALEATCPDEKPGSGGPWRLFVRSDQSDLRKLIREELHKPRNP